MERNVLKNELDYFEKIRNELMEKAKDEFVLIKNRNLIETFKSEDDAIRRGYKEFGNKPFLVKKVTETDEATHFTNLLIAI